MDISEAIVSRHSVRSYTDRELEDDVIKALKEEIEDCNKEGGLNIQLAVNEPKAFSGFMAHYGKFRNVKNYIALVGKKSADLDERLGYYGERLVLKAQILGLNTCWVAMSYSKSKAACRIGSDEKLVCVLALGYGETMGVQHKSKEADKVSRAEGQAPEWFAKGVEAALLAPTAMNQQKFMLTFNEYGVKAESTGGFYSKVDLGIVKYHFEIAAGKENFMWIE